MLRPMSLIEHMADPPGDGKPPAPLDPEKERDRGIATKERSKSARPPGQAATCTSAWRRVYLPKKSSRKPLLALSTEFFMSTGTACT